jgi:branched-chain amino acid transport system permease protein
VLIEQLINGVTLGAQYALVAAGLSLIFGVLGIVNFAHGEFFMLGAYMLYIAETPMGLNYPASALVVVVGMGLFGAVYYGVVLARIINHSWQVQLVATLATSLLMVNLAIVLAGPTPRLVDSPWSDAHVSIFGGQVSVQRLIVITTSAIAFLAMYLYLKHAKLGKAMRAVAQNKDAADVVGIPVRRVGLVAVVAGAALAGVAAVTIAPLNNLQPTMGQLLTIKAFAAVIMGGFGNVTGAILSAVVLGMVEALTAGYLTTDYADLVVFGVMLLVLLVRPSGIFGKVARV